MERLKQPHRRRRPASPPAAAVAPPRRILLAASLLAQVSLRNQHSAGCDLVVEAAALALPRHPVRPGGSDQRNSRGPAGSAASKRRSHRRGQGRGGSAGHGHVRPHRWHPRFFTSESVLPPLDVTELSAYASSPALNGTDFSTFDDDARDISAEELFTAPYIIPSAHQASDLGCSTHVCGPLPVLYTNHPKSIERWFCDNISGSSGGKEPCIVGFDVESVPTAPWIRKKASHDGPALVQISTPHACLVAQLTRAGGARSSTSCPALEPFLSDPTIIKAGAGIDDDMLELFRFNPRLRGASRFDLGGVGVDCSVSGHPARVGLARLARSVLGVEMRKSKKLAMSDWSRSPLDDDRVAYAARDAWAGAAVAHDLAERQPEIFGPGAVAELLDEERSVEDLDDRARRRRAAKRKMKEICEQFREYGDVDSGRTLREQMPDLVAEEMEKQQGIMDETAPDGLIFFDGKDIGLKMM